MLRLFLVENSSNFREIPNPYGVMMEEEMLLSTPLKRIGMSEKR